MIISAHTAGARSNLSKRPPPDFVIVGAPKCGTTSLHKTLHSHPEIFLPSIKEPHYFAFDFGNRRGVETNDAYTQLFNRAKANQLRGEASVMYLSSSEAIPALLEHRPDLKIIALVRNPIDMFVSWHNQCLKTLNENLTDPEQAWAMQEQRALGKMIPRLCHERLFLQYRRICSLGTQVERLAALVPSHQYCILTLEDIQQRPGCSYKRILDFLGVADDGRREFVHENNYARPRSRTIALLGRMLQSNWVLKRLRVRLKPALHANGFYMIDRALKSNLAPARKPELSAQFRQQLISEFRSEVATLENVLGRELTEWEEFMTVKAQDRRTKGSR